MFATDASEELVYKYRYTKKKQDMIFLSCKSRSCSLLRTYLSGIALILSTKIVL